MRLIPLLAVATLLLSSLAAHAQDALTRVASERVVYRSYDLSRWPLPSWRTVREARFPALGRWVGSAAGISNFIPRDADEKDIVAGKDGLGMVSAVLNGAYVKDCTVMARMGFERKGAPGILLRTQVEGNVTGDTLCLVLHEKGINLWRYLGGKWSKAAAAEMPVAEKELHHVRIALEGQRAKVWLDGEAVCETNEVGFGQPGTVGIWAGEGPCHFQALRFRGAFPGQFEEWAGTDVLKMKP